MIEPKAVWLVVYVRGSNEEKFRRWLTERAVGVYVPMRLISGKSRKKRKLIAKKVPAFPNCAFVKVWVGAAANWFVLRQAPGFCYAVSEAGEDGMVPIAIPDEEIGDLMSMEASGVFDGAPLSLIFAKDTPIEIQAGHLAGKMGRIEVAPKDERSPAVITVEGRKLKISVSLIRIIREDTVPGRFG